MDTKEGRKKGEKEVKPSHPITRSNRSSRGEQWNTLRRAWTILHRHPVAEANARKAERRISERGADRVEDGRRVSREITRGLNDTGAGRGPDVARLALFPLGPGGARVEGKDRRGHCLARGNVKARR